jgi:hypothetical protein
MIVTPTFAGSGGAIPKAHISITEARSNKPTGYDVSITRGPTPETADKLFFVNLGGYDAAEFGELHKNLLIVAVDAAAAKVKALTHVNGWFQPHKDRIFEVEKAVDITGEVGRDGYALTLRRASTERAFSFTCNYAPIG